MLVEAKLELGVGEDHTGARACSAAKEYSSIEASRTRSISALSPTSSSALEVDRLVVADFGLGAGREDRLWQPL